MKINIHELLNKSEVTFKGEEVISLFENNLSGYRQDSIVYVEGVITKEADRYLVNGNLSTTVKLSCDRCIQEVSYPICAELYRVFSSNCTEEDEDEDIVQITESYIDLSDAIREAVVLHIPMKVLCKENCNGICKVCGQDLNVTPCNCEQLDIDPRLEKFKNIFHPQSEE